MKKPQKGPKQANCYITLESSRMDINFQIKKQCEEIQDQIMKTFSLYVFSGGEHALFG